MAPAYSKMAMGQAAAPAVQARQLDAAVLSAAEQINRVELILCFQALLAPLSYDFPAAGILTDASKLPAVHDLISSYWSSSSDWQTFKATDAYRRAAPAFERFATLGGRFLPPLIPVGVVNGEGSSSDPTFPEWMSAFFKPPAAPAPPPPPPPIPSGAAAPAPPPGAAAPAPPGAAAPAAPPSGAAASAVDSYRLPRLSKDHPQVKNIATEAKLRALQKRQDPLVHMAVPQPQDRVDFQLFDRRVSNYQSLGRDGSSIATLQRGAASALRLVTQLEAAGAAPTLEKRAALAGFRKCLIFVLWSISERLHTLDPPLCTAPFGFGSPSYAFHDPRRAFCRDDVRALLSFMTDKFRQACQELSMSRSTPTLDVTLLPPGLPQNPESISTRLVHAYIVFAAFSDDDIKKAWAALREQQPVAFPPFFLAASHPKRTPWALASFNGAPSPSQFIPAAGPYHSFQTPHASYLPHPPLLLGGPGGPPPRQMMQNICFRCGDHGHKSNSCNKPQTTNPERLAGIAAARQRVAAHAAKRKATPTSDPRAKRNRT